VKESRISANRENNRPICSVQTEESDIAGKVSQKSANQKKMIRRIVHFNRTSDFGGKVSRITANQKNDSSISTF
jgi:hypothetical protein